MIHFNLIGPGRVGLALANALIHTGQYTLLGVYHPQQLSAKKAVQTLRHGEPLHTLGRLPKADITFITTQDAHIASIATQLAALNNLKPNSTIAHMSGILSSEVLSPLKKQGYSVGSLHPLKAFPQKNALEKTAFQHVNCAIEGDSLAIKQFVFLGKILGARLFKLRPEQKVVYHTAATIASNYLVTLAAVAMDLLKRTELPDTEAHELCTQLMQTSLDNLKQTDTIKQALTGPLMRGDIETIQKHLNAIDSSVTKTLYQVAGLATLPLVDLNSDQIKTIQSLFKWL